MKRVISILAAMTMLAGCLTGCGGTGKKDGAALTTVRVAVFERNDAPEGQGSTTDNKMTQWINQEAAKIGLNIEFVACPRDQETQKLNAWMASSNAPDIVFTYNNENTFQRYADQGGLCQLDEYLEKDGRAILDKMGGVLDYGNYQGKQFAIPGIRTLQPASNMKIRQDWLDKLGLAQPQNPEELYQVLKAFKEQDPGNVGRENVVPWAMAAPGVMGKYGGYGNILYAFGVKNYGDFGGTYENGEFRSAVDIPEAKEAYRYLNRLYQEGLIHREFAVDNNGSKFTQHVATGAAGLVDMNGAYIDNLTKDAVPDVNWMPIEPLADSQGSRMLNAYTKARWLNMVPKSSKVPEAAVRYMNWMVESKADITLTYGFEGTHYKVEDDVIIATTTDANAKDMWKGADLNLIGYVNYMVPRDKLDKVMKPEEAEKTAIAMDYTDKYAVEKPVITDKRPIAQEKASMLQEYVNTGVAKLIVAADFDAEYEKFVSGWYGLGGGDYDKEYQDALQAKEK